jgi:surface antigen
MKSMAPHTILMLTLLGTAGAAAALESGDAYAIDETAQRSLEYARTNQAAGWINPDTGSEGTFTPVATHEGPDGEVCREYSITAIIAGREEQVYGIACRQPDGTWMEANPGRSQDPPPAPVSVAYPQTTVVYPYPWWGLVSSFAFSGSYCSDGFCFGGRYGYPYPYGSYYPYRYGNGYYPYSFRFNYSYYHYDDHRDGYRYRSHHDRQYRYNGHDRNNRYNGHDRNNRYNGHDRNDRQGGHHARGGDSRAGRSQGNRSRGDRSGSSRVARVSRHH